MYCICLVCFGEQKLGGKNEKQDQNKTKEYKNKNRREEKKSRKDNEKKNSNIMCKYTMPYTIQYTYIYSI